MNTNGLVCFIEACKLIQEEAPKFRIPFLIMSGENDRVIENKLCEQYIDLCTSLKPADKQHEHYQGMGHELHRDVNRHLVFKRAL
jgi:alpha-beta hydrolase superfamily lysophospholipase